MNRTIYADPTTWKRLEQLTQTLRIPKSRAITEALQLWISQKESQLYPDPAGDHE